MGASAGLTSRPKTMPATATGAKARANAANARRARPPCAARAAWSAAHAPAQPAASTLKSSR